MGILMLGFGADSQDLGVVGGRFEQQREREQKR
jgi:hypothetical protein